MFKNLLFKLGSDPVKSWADFRIGLVIFVVGVALIYAGAAFWMWFQIPGIICLAAGIFFALKGYVGIFANRFSQTLNRLTPPDEKDK